MSGITVDWAALGQVFGATVALTVGLVGLFTVGIVGSSRRASAEGGGTGGATTAPGVPARIGAVAAFALCAAAVGYGIYVIAA